MYFEEANDADIFHVHRLRNPYICSSNSIIKPPEFSVLKIGSLSFFSSNVSSTPTYSSSIQELIMQRMQQKLQKSCL